MVTTFSISTRRGLHWRDMSTRWNSIWKDTHDDKKYRGLGTCELALHFLDIGRTIKYLLAATVGNNIETKLHLKTEISLYGNDYGRVKPSCSDERRREEVERLRNRCVFRWVNTQALDVSFVWKDEEEMTFFLFSASNILKNLLGLSILSYLIFSAQFPFFSSSSSSSSQSDDGA